MQIFHLKENYFGYYPEWGLILVVITHFVTLLWSGNLRSILAVIIAQETLLYSPVEINNVIQKSSIWDA